MNMTPEEIKACQERVIGKFQAGDALALWDTLSNPANTTSRAAMAVYGAPTIKATIKDWREWLGYIFPHFEQALADKQTAYEKERIEREKAWELENLKRTATSGTRWSQNGKSFPHALAFVEYLLSNGWTYEKRNIGVVVWRNGEVSLKGMRNAHINAAIKFLEVHHEKTYN